MYDSFNHAAPDPSGDRPRPGVALAVVALAAAGLTGAAVGGLTWTFDRYTGSASAGDPHAYDFDGDARGTAPGTVGPTGGTAGTVGAGGAAGTPGWAETLVLPVTPSTTPTAGSVNNGARLSGAKPGPVAPRGGAAGGVLRTGEAGTDPGATTGSGGSGANESTEPAPVPSDPGVPDPGDPGGDPGPSGDPGSDLGPSGDPTGGPSEGTPSPSDPAPDGDPAASESATPAASPSAHRKHGGWFIFRR